MKTFKRWIDSLTGKFVSKEEADRRPPGETVALSQNAIARRVRERAMLSRALEDTRHEDDNEYARAVLRRAIERVLDRGDNLL